MFSGEIDWPFKVNMLSIENMIQLFKHIDTQEDKEELKEKDYANLPTYNGLTTPTYITKEPNIKILQDNEKDGVIKSRIKG